MYFPKYMMNTLGDGKSIGKKIFPVPSEPRGSFIYFS